MTTNFSIWEMVTNAGWVVQIVLAILAVASIISWTIIFQKQREFRVARLSLKNFEQKFWSGIDLSQLYRDTENHGDKEDAGLLGGIFTAGFGEFARLLSKGREGSSALDSARRAMTAARTRGLEQHENSLNFLATVGSTAPYVGLFGTVWGIMDAFQGLGNVEQATLSMVAPGISQALIATAMGLFAAIPATIAYNRFASQLDQLESRSENFTDEFSNVLEHNRDAVEGAAG